MEKAVFEKLQAHIFDKGNPWVDIWADKTARPNKLPYFSSWAIYGENEVIDKEVLEDEVIRSLNNNVVFVGLNFSYALPSSWGFWHNIYANYNVKWLLSGENFNVEKYRGAYITDIIKNVVGKNASTVSTNLTLENINKNIGWFFEEIDLLGSDSIEMFVFGTVAADLFSEHVMKRNEFPAFQKKVRKCQHINHYSKKNEDTFRKYAPAELGLIASSSTVKRWLWNIGRGTKAVR